MAPSPYRLHDVDAADARGTPRVERPWDISIVVLILWITSVVHLAIAWAVGGAAARELTIPCLVVIFAPIVVYKERRG